MSAINMSEKRTVNRKLTQIKKSCETYILSAIEHEADGNRMARFKTRIENQIIKIYTDHPGYKDTIMRELLRIERNTFGLYFDNIGFDNVGMMIASIHFKEMAKKYHDQQNLPVIASASCNSTRTVGGKRKNKNKNKNKNKSKTRRRSRI
jgi:hypothetical protein